MASASDDPQMNKGTYAAPGQQAYPAQPQPYAGAPYQQYPQQQYGAPPAGYGNAYGQGAYGQGAYPAAAPASRQYRYWGGVNGCGKCVFVATGIFIGLGIIFLIVGYSKFSSCQDSYPQSTGSENDINCGVYDQQQNDSCYNCFTNAAGLILTGWIFLVIGLILACVSCCICCGGCSSMYVTEVSSPSYQQF